MAGHLRTRWRLKEKPYFTTGLSLFCNHIGSKFLTKINRHSDSRSRFLSLDLLSTSEGWDTPNSWCLSWYKFYFPHKNKNCCDYLLRHKVLIQCLMCGKPSFKVSVDYYYFWLLKNKNCQLKCMWWITSVSPSRHTFQLFYSAIYETNMDSFFRWVSSPVGFTGQLGALMKSGLFLSVIFLSMSHLYSVKKKKAWFLSDIKRLATYSLGIGIHRLFVLLMMVACCFELWETLSWFVFLLSTP